MMGAGKHSSAFGSLSFCAGNHPVGGVWRFTVQRPERLWLMLSLGDYNAAVFSKYPPTSTFCKEVSVKKGMDTKQLVLKWVRNAVAGLGLQKLKLEVPKP